MVEIDFWLFYFVFNAFFVLLDRFFKAEYVKFEVWHSECHIFEPLWAGLSAIVMKSVFKD